jgi:hypothetical protein
MYLLLFLLSTIFNTHEFHVSQCEIQYRPAQGHVAVVMHIFIDDLEAALSAKGYDSIYLCTEKERADANDLIASYLNENFIFEADDAPINFTMLGKEVSEDLMAIWCYIEAENIPPFESAVISNKVLLETFDDQKNILSFEYQGYKKKHFLFDRSEPLQKISF